MPFPTDSCTAGSVIVQPDVRQAVRFIQRMAPEVVAPSSVSGGNSRNPMIGVILGSGLGCAANRLESQGGQSIPYQTIPGMPNTSVAGHSGRLVTGNAGGVPVLMLQGRCHLYEGHSPGTVTFATQVLCELGIRHLIITNAAGGINSAFRPGDLMLINGHLISPSVGACLQQASSSGLFPTGESAQTSSRSYRCRNGTGIWSSDLLDRALAVETSLQIHQGVYALMPGPCYETPAEIRMLRTLGADAVGMSTVPEALLASLLGVSVLGVSCITNTAAGLADNKLDHAEVTSTAASIEAAFSNWLWDVIQLCE